MQAVPAIALLSSLSVNFDRSNLDNTGKISAAVNKRNFEQEIKYTQKSLNLHDADIHIFHLCSTHFKAPHLLRVYQGRNMIFNRRIENFEDDSRRLRRKTEGIVKLQDIFQSHLDYFISELLLASNLHLEAMEKTRKQKHLKGMIALEVPLDYIQLQWERIWNYIEDHPEVFDLRTVVESPAEVLNMVSISLYFVKDPPPQCSQLLSMEDLTDITMEEKKIGQINAYYDRIMRVQPRSDDEVLKLELMKIMLNLQRAEHFYQKRDYRKCFQNACDALRASIRCFGKYDSSSARWIVKAHLANQQPSRALSFLKECSEVGLKDLQDLEIQASSDAAAAAAAGKLADSNDAKERESSKLEKLKGDKLFNVKNYKGAVECYTLSLKSNPWNMLALAARAKAHLRLNENEAAEEDCTAAITLDHNYVETFFMRGSARKNLQKYEESIRDYRHVLKLAPRSEQVINEELQSINQLKAERVNGK
eukprot:TRINITY_DN18127_c0_g1_i1.p1 TRINITY_DN18127_c0_g1~~TRINITY_DN18127_c0_g1_i1.p1  ORF type:complete len:478 (+),score=49.79 TRINITY_DN18127_c0_g1_i1:93-1526(+)